MYSICLRVWKCDRKKEKEGVCGGKKRGAGFLMWIFNTFLASNYSWQNLEQFWWKHHVWLKIKPLCGIPLGCRVDHKHIICFLIFLFFILGYVILHIPPRPWTHRMTMLLFSSTCLLPWMMSWCCCFCFNRGEGIGLLFSSRLFPTWWNANMLCS